MTSAPFGNSDGGGILNLLEDEENAEIGVKAGEGRISGNATRGDNMERETKGEDRAKMRLLEGKM